MLLAAPRRINDDLAASWVGHGLDLILWQVRARHYCTILTTQRFIQGSKIRCRDAIALAFWPSDNGIAYLGNVLCLYILLAIRPCEAGSQGLPLGSKFRTYRCGWVSNFGIGVGNGAKVERAGVEVEGWRCVGFLG